MDVYIRRYDVPAALLFYHALCIEYHHADQVGSHARNVRTENGIFRKEQNSK